MNLSLIIVLKLNLKMSDYNKLKSAQEFFETHSVPLAQNTFVVVGGRKYVYKETPTGGEWIEVKDEI